MVVLFPLKESLKWGQRIKSFISVGSTNSKSFTFSTCMEKQDIALSMSFACGLSHETDIATAAAISEDLNSKKSIPAFNFPNHELDQALNDFLRIKNWYNM